MRYRPRRVFPQAACEVLRLEREFAACAQLRDAAAAEAASARLEVEARVWSAP